MITESKNILKSLELRISALKSRSLPLNQEALDMATRELLQVLLGDFDFQWSFYAAGSWGRQDLHSESDQDHFFMTSRSLTDSESEIINAGFRMIQDFLEELGLRKCDAGIMASEKKWQFVSNDEKLLVLSGQLQEVMKFNIMYYSRVINNIDLKPPGLYQLIKSTAYRKLQFRFYLTLQFSLISTLARTKRRSLLKSIIVTENILYETAGLPDRWVTKEFDHGYFKTVMHSMSSFKRVITRYGDLFPS